MITARAFAGKRYAVLGLARSGAAAVRALLASGAEVLAWDEDEGRRNTILPELARGGGPPAPAGGGGGEAASLRFAAAPSTAFGGPPPEDELGEDFTLADPLHHDLTGYAGVIVSPGVPLNTHPIKPHADSFGVPVIGDIELFALARPELPPHKVVGITGTNGKSTTTALVHHILKTAGVPTLMGGNIGLPILAQEPLPEDGVYVLELSSFQIDLTFSLDCEVAVFLNITPDHLDRYESFEAYFESKARLFEMQSRDHYALTGMTTPEPEELLGRFDQVCYIAKEPHLLKLNKYPALRGMHNLENLAAASYVCRSVAIDLSESAIEAGLKTFPGLPHRMELVAEHEGVLFINDSKATNQASAAPALAAYPPADGHPRIHWIVGGQAKESGLAELADWTGHVAVAYTIGEAGPAFADLLAGRVVVERCGTLHAAVGRAAAAARPGDVVLLSPASASFDQFRDFEERGEMFRKYVADLFASGSTGRSPIGGSVPA